MKLILVVYRIDEKEYPNLVDCSPEQIEYWVREGNLSLGAVYDTLPDKECFFEYPTSVAVIE